MLLRGNRNCPPLAAPNEEEYLSQVCSQFGVYFLRTTLVRLYADHTSLRVISTQSNCPHPPIHSSAAGSRTCISVTTSPPHTNTHAHTDTYLTTKNCTDQRAKKQKYHENGFGKEFKDFGQGQLEIIVMRWGEVVLTFSLLSFSMVLNPQHDDRFVSIKLFSTGFHFSTLQQP